MHGQEHIGYLDSGCSRHMTWVKSLLDAYVKEDSPIVTYGDNNKGETKGFGVIKFKSMNMKNVFYFAGLQNNLISRSQLCDDSYKVFFS